MQHSPQGFSLYSIVNVKLWRVNIPLFVPFPKKRVVLTKLFYDFKITHYSIIPLKIKPFLLPWKVLFRWNEMVLHIGSSSLQYYHLPVHHSGGQISAILLFRLICVFKTQSWKSNSALFPVHKDGRLRWLVPSKQWYCGRHPQKKIFSSASWILNSIVKIKRSERGAPACWKGVVMAVWHL